MMNKELPEAYEIGWIPFIHTKIFLDSRPLIPRTETEYWVDLVIKKIKESSIQNPKVLDLCAGSGCIGVAVAKDIPSAKVDFVEIDTAHHPTIEKNVQENNIESSRIRIFGGNLFENITDQYDFILSNPPYIDKSLNRVAESVKEYEPELALYGGKEGMEIIKRILTQAPAHLNPGGELYIEHEPEQTLAISQFRLYRETLTDQYGTERYSVFDTH